jgi:type I restriction enzyme M protein
MRRLDQALESTKAPVLERAAQLGAQGTSDSGMELVLLRVTELPFYNRSKLSFPQVLDDQGNIDGYSSLAREVIEKFGFERHIDRLDEANLLFQVIGRICTVDLHPDKVSNLEMGYLFEELIRRFSEASKRDGRRALHPPRGRQADGQPAA